MGSATVTMTLNYKGLIKIEIYLSSTLQPRHTQPRAKFHYVGDPGSSCFVAPPSFECCSCLHVPRWCTTTTSAFQPVKREREKKKGKAHPFRLRLYTVHINLNLTTWLYLDARGLKYAGYSDKNFVNSKSVIKDKV